MRHQGFATASFVQNTNGGLGAGLHQGYGSQFESKIVGDRAEALYNKKLYDWIEENSDQNMFLYLHLVDPHGPYDPPPSFNTWHKEPPQNKRTLKRRKNIDPEWVKTVTKKGRRSLYDGEINYNDYYFKSFIHRLKQYELMNDSLVVFISDHGEHLGEHDLWSHRPPGYVQCINVPLIMTFPEKLPKGIQVSQPVQLLDIMPTILELAEVKSEHIPIQGDSLVPLMLNKNKNFWDRRVVISEEVMDRQGKSDPGRWASLIYKNWHIINSASFHTKKSIPDYFGTWCEML